MNKIRLSRKPYERPQWVSVCMYASHRQNQYIDDDDEDDDNDSMDSNGTSQSIL